MPSGAVPPLGGFNAGSTEKLACDNEPVLELELLLTLELELELDVELDELLLIELDELLETLLELELELIELLTLLLELELELVELLTLLLELEELETLDVDDEELILDEEDEATSFFAAAGEPEHAASNPKITIQAPRARTEYQVVECFNMSTS